MAETDESVSQAEGEDHCRCPQRQESKYISRTIPAEVARFAEEQGVAGLLEPILAMTESVFPGSRPTLELDDDPEIAQDRHIVVEVTSRNHHVDDGLAKLARWHEGLFQCCPGIHAHLFRIGLRLV